MLKPQSTYMADDLKVNVFLFANNNPNKIDLPSKRTKPIIGITIHNTNDLDNVEDDSEQYTRATYNGNMGTVRTHYYVDDIAVWQNLPDDVMNWTCADGANGVGNCQTIAIECIMNNETDTMSLKARENTAKLTAYLLKKHGLTTNDVYTHTHWLHKVDGVKGTREELNVKPHRYKTCPLYIIPHWDDFIKQVEKYFGTSSTSTSATPENPIPSKAPTLAFAEYKVKVIDPDPNGLNIRAEANFSSKVVGTAPKGIYTIVEEKIVNNVLFAKLKSGAGWIVVKNGFAEKV